MLSPRYHTDRRRGALTHIYNKPRVPPSREEQEQLALVLLETRRRLCFLGDVKRFQFLREVLEVSLHVLFRQAAELIDGASVQVAARMHARRGVRGAVLALVVRQ